jgi:hypothetical protein
MAFQSQDVMTDQRLEPTKDGFRLKGSLPPGPTTLTWAFDLPVHGTEQSFDFPLPWRAYIYRVIADEAERMRLDVRGFPVAQSREEEGRRLLFTQLERKPGDPELGRVVIRIAGIPGPGMLRWISLGLSVMIVIFGVAYGLHGKDTTHGLLIGRRKEQLLKDASELDGLAESGEIGPKYKEKRRQAIVDELASILREEQLILKASDRRLPE